jgi:hypothetical protein
MVIISKAREAAVAGSFYPAEKAELSAMIKKFLTQAKNFHIKPSCIVVPHAGYVYSGQIAAAAYKQLLNLEQKRWKVILLGPSHYRFFEGAAASPFKVWKTPLGDVKAEELKNKTKNKIKIFSSADVHSQEHCLEVQLPFLQSVLKRFTIVPILTGQVEPKELAELLLRHLEERTLLIISSDLSHYHSYERAKAIDALANEAIPSLDLVKAQHIEACGKIALLTALHIAKKLRWKGHFLAYCNSGDIAAKEEVVGYGAYAFTKS